MVGRLTLDQEVGVRIPAPQLRKPRKTAHNRLHDRHVQNGDRSARQQPHQKQLKPSAQRNAPLFSDQITTGHESYGPAGVVIALISFLVGFGVCLHAGAVFGRMWNEWRDERAPVASEV
jgi:hypothetical protein